MPSTEQKLREVEGWSRERLAAELQMDGMRLVEPEEPRGGPVCCCEHGGQPYELEPGLWVTSRNVGCRVHAPRPPAYESISDEPAESWARFKRLAT